MKYFKVSYSFLLLLFSLTMFSACEQPVTDECQTACEMEPDAGPCLAAFQRYYYDTEEGKCKMFVWGGCGEVPFETLEECEACGCQ